MQEVQETLVPSLGWNNPLEEEIATHSSILAWKIPWTLVGYSFWGCKELVLEFRVLNFRTSVWPSHWLFFHPTTYHPPLNEHSTYSHVDFLGGSENKICSFLPQGLFFFFFNMVCLNLLVLKMQSTNQCLSVQVATQMSPPHRSFLCCCEHPSPSYLWWSVLCVDLGRLYSPVI